jgi:hypothetical protein
MKIEVGTYSNRQRAVLWENGIVLEIGESSQDLPVKELIGYVLDQAQKNISDVQEITYKEID